MAMIEINKDPSRRELSWFGLLVAAFFGIVGAIVFWQFDAPVTARAIWIAGVGITLLYYVLPPLRRPLYLGWIYAALPIGWVISHVLMGLIFYVVFLLVGLGMRLCRYDPMRRRFDPGASTYWVEHRPGGNPDRYFRQF